MLKMTASVMMMILTKLTINPSFYLRQPQEDRHFIGGRVQCQRSLVWSSRPHLLHYKRLYDRR